MGNKVKAQLPPSMIPKDITKRTLDDTATLFMDNITQIINSSIPRAKPSPYAKKWWCQDLTLLRNAMTSIRNQVTALKRQGLDITAAQRQLQVSRRSYFGQMEKQKKQHWREFLRDPTNIWKANQYTHNTSHASSVPTLIKGERVAESEKEKV